MNEAAIQRTAGYLPWIEIGEFRVQSYFVVISLVLCLCALWISRRAESREMSSRRALDLFLVAMAGGLLGSRLLHVLWEEPAYYAQSPWLVFDVMSGGFVWYGGALGAALALYLWVRFAPKFDETAKRERDFLKWLDFFAPVTAFGYAGGRLACVLTGCCFGRVCEWPFGIATIDHEGHTHGIFYRFPTQWLAVAWELAVLALLLYFERHSTRRTRARGFIFFSWLTLHGIGRVMMELLRDDPRGPSVAGFTISLVISVMLISIGLTGLAKRPVSK